MKNLLCKKKRDILEMPDLGYTNTYWQHRFINLNTMSHSPTGSHKCRHSHNGGKADTGGNLGFDVLPKEAGIEPLIL